MDIDSFFLFCAFPYLFFVFIGYVLANIFHYSGNTTVDNGDNTFFYTSMWMDD